MANATEPSLLLRLNVHGFRRKSITDTLNELLPRLAGWLHDVPAGEIPGNS
jgi:hypothetical protein